MDIGDQRRTAGSRRTEPEHVGIECGPAIGIPLIGEQNVDHPRTALGGWPRQILADFIVRRDAADQIDRHAAQERQVIDHRNGLVGDARGGVFAGEDLIDLCRPQWRRTKERHGTQRGND